MQTFFSYLFTENVSRYVSTILLALVTLTFLSTFYFRRALRVDDRSTAALREDVALAVAKANVSLDQLADIASTHGLGSSDVYGALQYCLREALTGRQVELAQKSDAVSNLLSELISFSKIESLTIPPFSLF